MTVALIAHDARKDLMVEWVGRHLKQLTSIEIVATGTTGSRIADAFPGLRVRAVKSGPLGGDQQVGAMIAEGVLKALIFFVDPMTPLPHDVDVKALTRLAIVYDIPHATNPSTADAVLDFLLRTESSGDVAGD